MPEIFLDGLKIYYESHGQGEPLILIRGLGSNADHWYPQVPDFAAHYRVIVFDNRGIGRSGDPGEDVTIQNMAADTIGLMDALHIERAHILGVSMGGMIAQEIAIHHAQRVKSLILVVTHGGGERQLRAEASVIQLIRAMVLEGSLSSRIAALPAFFDPLTLKQNPACVQTYAAAASKYPADTKILSSQWRAVQAHDVYDRLPAIQAPTLVLASEGDVLIPPGNSELLAKRIPNARLVTIAGGGHQILIEQPNACNQAVLEFLQALDRGGIE